MADLTQDIAGLVESLVTPLLEHPEELELNASCQGTEILVELAVNEEDAGKVIGRQGRVIKSIRTLARAAAARGGMHVEVELVD